VQTPDKGSLA